MNVSQNNIDSVNASLLITVTVADYAENVAKELKDARKKANMPGFRPGAVPSGLIKKMYGKSIIAEEINKLVSKALYEHIQNNKLNVLGEPLPTEGFPAPSFEEEGKDFEFSFDIGIAPEVDAKLSTEDSLTQYNITVGEDLMEKQIASYRGKFGKQVTVDVVEEKDLVKGEIIELGEDGEPKAGGASVPSTVISPAYMKDKDEQAKVIGLKVGASFNFNPTKAFENPAEIASLLQIDKEVAQDFTADCQFIIAEITRHQEAELNQEFFDASFGKDTVKTEEEFNAKIKEGLTEQFSSDSDVKLMIDAREYVINKLKDIVFPEAFLKRWLKLSDQKMTDETIEKDFPKMIEDLKWQLAKDKLAKDNDLKIEKEDIEAVAKEMAKAQFAQYGMPNVPEEMLSSYVQDMLKNEDGMKNATARAAETKTIALLKTLITLKAEDISFEDFNKFFENN